MINKTVILTAGVGSRLGELTKDKPKILLDFNGRTILERQIETFHNNGVKEFVIVAGHGLEKVKEEVTKIQGKLPDVKVKIIVNHDFASTQNTYSLWLTKEDVENGFYLIDGDVIAEQAVIDKICKTPHANAIIGDSKCDIEVLTKIGKEGRVIGIGKHIPKEEGKFGSVGIHKFSADFVAHLFPAIEELFRERGMKVIYEHAYEKILDKVDLKVEDVTGLTWREIDLPEEYEQAKELFRDR